MKSIEENQLKLGGILREADLLSDFQIQVALKYQARFPSFCFEEILAMYGWVQPHTCDFFINKWEKLIKSKYRKPLGYYLLKSGLLEKSEVDHILLEQQTLPYRFGRIAVLKGYLKPSTVDFFLRYLFPEELGEPPLRTFESILRSKQRHYLYCCEAIKRSKALKE